MIKEFKYPDDGGYDAECQCGSGAITHDCKLYDNFTPEITYSVIDGKTEYHLVTEGGVIAGGDKSSIRLALVRMAVRLGRIGVELDAHEV